MAQLVKKPPAIGGTWIQSLVCEDPWRSERLPTSVFWPGQFHGLYSSWGYKELDMTEQLSLSPLLVKFSSVHFSRSVVSDYLRPRGILQARMLEWVAFPFSRESSQPKDWTQVSGIAGRFFYQLSHKGSPRILERVAHPFSRGSSPPRNQTTVSCIEGRFFTNWAIREAHKHKGTLWK